MEGSGPSLPLCAVSQHHFTAPTERTPSQGNDQQGNPFLATMLGGDMEGSGPSLPLCAVSQHHFTAPTERTPSRGSGQRRPCVGDNDVRQRLGGLRSLAAAVRRKPTPFHGADGADALQVIRPATSMRW
jgi:hypothetical protein